MTEAEARAFLDTAIDVGLAGDYRALCAMNGSVSNCELTLDVNPLHPPATTRPESITGHHVGAGDGNDTAGWVFTVEGRAGDGMRYATEVMVFRDHEDRLKGTNLVWWSGARLVVGDGAEDVIETAPTS
ncbi:MAG TPA: hypothetical protein VNQ77_15935 [Frankiaceae bacterium]|nr:hypothetical protein [Frankiaceae bacterium]